MSLSVLVGCRARRGHGAVVAAIAAAETASWTRSGDVLNRGLTLGSVNGEEMTFLLGEWDTLTSLHVGLEQRATREKLGRYCVVEPECYAFRMLVFYESMGRPRAVIGGAVLEAPPGQAARAETFLRDQRERLLRYRGLGLALHALYRDAAAPHRFMVLHGWSSPEALDAFRQAHHEALARSRAFGIAERYRFSSHPRAASDLAYEAAVPAPPDLAICGSR
ncbi:MAG TPA: hypothetical protein VII06_22295 [Chloroflexota bacterium]|jgi:quinol monooxygenase YgiN